MTEPGDDHARHRKADVRTGEIEDQHLHPFLPEELYQAGNRSLTVAAR